MKRAINKNILVKAKGLEKGQVLKTVATNRALAKVLGINEQTVCAWKKAGILPFRQMEGAPHIPIYNVKAVIKALETWNEQIDAQIEAERDRDYQRRMDMIERSIFATETKNRSKNL